MTIWRNDRCQSGLHFEHAVMVRVRVRNMVRVRVSIRVSVRAGAADCCIQTARKSDKMRINQVINTDHWRSAPQSLRPAPLGPLRILSCPTPRVLAFTVAASIDTAFISHSMVLFTNKYTVYYIYIRIVS